MPSQDDVRFRIGADTRSLDSAMRNTRRAIDRDVNGVKVAFEGMDRSIGGSLQSTGRSFMSFRNTLAGTTAALGSFVLASRAIIGASDAYKRMESQLRLVTETAEEAEAVQRMLFATAQATAQGMEGTVSLYAQLARSTQDLGLSQQQLVSITETISKALVVGGVSAQEAEGALRQLGQGFAAGALRGEEFNSVAEGAPPLIRAIADSLGVGIGELREMAAEGQITADVMARAFQDQAQTIDRQFSQVSDTVEMAMTRAGNSVQALAAEFSDASGLGDLFIDILNEVSTAADTLTASLSSTASAFDVLRGLASAAQTFALPGAQSYDFDVDALEQGQILEDITTLNREIAEAQARYEALRRDMTAPAGPGTGARSLTEQERAALQGLQDEIDSMITRRAVLLGGAGMAMDMTGDWPNRPAQVTPPGVAPPAMTPSRGTAPGGGGGGSAGRAAGTRAERDAVAELVAAMQRKVEMLEIERRALGLTDQEATAYKMVQEALLDLARQGVEVTPEQRAEIEALADAYATGEQRIRDYNEQQEEAARRAEELDGLLEDVGQTAANAFADAVEGGQSFGEIIRGLIADLIRLQSVQQAVGSIFGDLFDGGGFNFGGLFGSGGGIQVSSGGYVPNQVPGRAAGGPVSAGRAYLVGERQPEIFVPNQSGTILPNAAAGAGGSGGVNNFYIDNRGADAAQVAQLRRELYALAGPGRVEERSVAATTDRRARNPALFRSGR